MLRKSKATHDIMDGVPLSVVESRGSWTKGSRAIHECYIAVHDEDKKNAYKKKYGIPYENGNKNNEQLELKRCDRCQSILENSSKFCSRCGFCTDKTMRELKKQVNEATTSLVDKDMLSDMIKKIVLEEMKSK